MKKTASYSSSLTWKDLFPEEQHKYIQSLIDQARKERYEEAIKELSSPYDENGMCGEEDCPCATKLDQLNK